MWFEPTSTTGSSSVGVVVAVRNGAAFIGSALSSVLSGGIVPNEVVVVDGGSTDNTVAIASGFDGVRVLAQRSSGLAGGRNEGVAALRSDLVAFCDADDCWTPTSLADRLNHLRADPGCAAVVGTMVTVAVDGEPVPAVHADRLGRSTVGLTPGALLVRADVFADVGGFDTGLRIAADSDWFARLGRSQRRLDRIDDVVLHKGVRPASLSGEVVTYRRELLSVTRDHLRHHRRMVSP
jgi:glycosyltransferase involved in cell wall biosynthesis